MDDASSCRERACVPVRERTEGGWVGEREEREGERERERERAKAPLGVRDDAPVASKF